MKTTIVANPTAGSGKVGRYFKIYQSAIQEVFSTCDAKLTSYTNRADKCVAEATAEGAERIVIVGGDGTLCEVINGLPFSQAHGSQAALPDLVYLPAGTGGDFARSIGASDLKIKEALQSSTSRPIDVGRVDLKDQEDNDVSKYFANVASIGASALVVEKVNRSSKKLGGTLSFMLGAVHGLFEWRDRRIRLRIDDVFDEVLPLCALAIANGRYFGGGMKIAPNALLDDGLFDLILIKEAGISTFLRHSSKLYKGTHLTLPIISSYTGKTIRVDPADDNRAGIPIETDGESIGNLPARITLLPKSLHLTAPWSTAEALSGNS